MKEKQISHSTWYASKHCKKESFFMKDDENDWNRQNTLIAIRSLNGHIGKK